MYILAANLMVLLQRLRTPDIKFVNVWAIFHLLLILIYKVKWNIQCNLEPVSWHYAVKSKTPNLEPETRCTFRDCLIIDCPIVFYDYWIFNDFG